MSVDIYEIARCEAMFLGHQHSQHTTLESVLVGELPSELRADIARMRLHGIIREYVTLPAAAVDQVMAARWLDLEDAFTSAQTRH